MHLLYQRLQIRCSPDSRIAVDGIRQRSSGNQDCKSFANNKWCSTLFRRVSPRARFLSENGVSTRIERFSQCRRFLSSLSIR